MSTFPIAPGHPDYSGTYIPEVWSGKLLVKFYESTVFGEIANTDYEGDISAMGDVVHIRTTPDITIKDYAKGQKINYETPETNLVDLKIDKGKTWAFRSDDVDKHQADINYLDDWTTAASNKGASAGVKTEGFNLGATGSPLSLDKTNIVDYIADCGTVLDEQSAPQENRYFVLPPWACNLIKKSDLKDASLSGDGTSIMRNGRVGMIDRFEIYMSNSLSMTSDSGQTPTNMIFGQKSALTFASQFIENEGPFRHPDFFGDFYRGLQVYGYEVTKGEAMGHFYGYKG